MADRIVQPKVLASTNPDTYDNLIMAQAQNATNAANGIITKTFNSYSDFYSWYSSNLDANYLYIDISFLNNTYIEPYVFVIASDKVTFTGVPDSIQLENISINGKTALLFGLHSQRGSAVVINPVELMGYVTFTQEGISCDCLGSLLVRALGTQELSIYEFRTTSLYSGPQISASSSMNISIGYFS